MIFPSLVVKVSLRGADATIQLALPPRERIKACPEFIEG